jgi:hypothetical protein
MKFRSLDKKRIENDKLRMTEPFILFTDNQRELGEHTVSLDEVARPDLIALKYYKNIDFVEIILKYNNISNPFSINEGDVLIIPVSDDLLEQWKPVKKVGEGKTSEKSVRDQFVDQKRLTVVDKKRIEYLQKKASEKENGSKQILPPNILKEGDSNIRIDNDIITI